MSMSDFLWIVSSCQIKEIKEKQRKGKERKVKKVRNADFSSRWREVLLNNVFFFKILKSSLDFGPPDDILVMMTSQGS